MRNNYLELSSSPRVNFGEPVEVRYGNKHPQMLYQCLIPSIQTRTALMQILVRCSRGLLPLIALGLILVRPRLTGYFENMDNGAAYFPRSLNSSSYPPSE